MVGRVPNRELILVFPKLPRMNNVFFWWLGLFFCGFSASVLAQHQTKLTVDYLPEKQTLNVYQELTFHNTTGTTLSVLVLNDWIHAYSDRNTPLAERFADEFVRSFHVATAKERGATHGLSVIDDQKTLLDWSRLPNHPDLIAIPLREPLAPLATTTLTLSYHLKLPDQRFTGIGFNSDNEVILDQWILTPARWENGDFLKYSNLNIDDATNAPMEVELLIRPAGFQVVSDLTLVAQTDTAYRFVGKNRIQVHLYLSRINDFQSFNNERGSIVTNLQEKRINSVQKAILIEKIENYVTAFLGNNPLPKTTVTQDDYDRNPFYGLNQLPNFIRPFPDDFVFELKFLKTYIYNRLKTTLLIDPRQDNWLFDAIQIYIMMQYIDEHYPEMKMMGALGKINLLKGYRLLSLDFNEQYSYFYMLMARKNLDQPLGDSKDKLLRFNEKIASKYRAGLSFRYLSEYIGKDQLGEALDQFLKQALVQHASTADFKQIVAQKTEKDVHWFFDHIIQSRKIIDYKLDLLSKTKDSVTFQLKNRTGVEVPIPIYGIKKKEVVFKTWLEPQNQNQVFTIPRKEADKLVLNYENTVPEFNQRNNWKSLKSFFISNRPLKFRFLKDLEDPNYNQIMYLPVMGFNYYDGVILGLSLNNRTVLDKPINFDVIPSYSTNSSSLSGSANITFNQFLRNSNLFSIKYGVGGSHFRYAPDATYQKLTPFVQMRIREKDYRKNHIQIINFRNVYVNREPSLFVQTPGENRYSVTDFRYTNTDMTITHTFSYSANFQIASQFSKTSAEVVYRHLFQNNRQVNIRFFGGIFLRNNDTKDFFSFALERPTDYLFDYPFLGRSESTGIFRQQFITAEGGFKSRFANQLANEWLVSTNLSGSIWNWIEAYADFGVLKDHGQEAVFRMDSGIRFNLITDYLEFYFPIYSSMGWDFGRPNYHEQIRFVFTIDPRSLVGLFTRKWF